MNEERRTLVSVPIWAIILVVLFIVSVVVLVNTLTGGVKEVEKIMEEGTSTSTMDDAFWGAVDKVENVIEQDAAMYRNENKVENENTIDTPSIDDVIASAIGIGNSTEVTDEKIKKEALDISKKYIENYYRYENNNIGTFPSILVDLGLDTEENISKLQDNNMYAIGNYKSNVRYEDFKASMLYMVTESYFNDYYSYYTNEDGYVTVNNGAGSYIPLEVMSLESITYDSIFKTYDCEIKIKDVELFEHAENGEQISEDEIYFLAEVSLKYVNGVLVIDSLN